MTKSLACDDLHRWMDNVLECEVQSSPYQPAQSLLVLLSKLLAVWINMYQDLIRLVWISGMYGSRVLVESAKLRNHTSLPDHRLT